MKPYVKEIWEEYHKHAPQWLHNVLTPCMSGAFLHDVFPFIPLREAPRLSSESILKPGSPLMIIPEYVIEKSEEYIKDPSKCTKSPWVYWTEKYFPEVDYKWIDTIIQGRTDDYEKITKDIYDGAAQLAKVQPCYDLSDVLDYIKGRL